MSYEEENFMFLPLAEDHAFGAEASRWKSALAEADPEIAKFRKRAEQYKARGFFSPDTDVDALVEYHRRELSRPQDAIDLHRRKRGAFGETLEKQQQRRGLWTYLLSEHDMGARAEVRKRYGKVTDLQHPYSEKRKYNDVARAWARNEGYEDNPEVFFESCGLPLPDGARTQDELFSAMGNELASRARAAWDRQQTKLAQYRELTSKAQNVITKRLMGDFSEELPDDNADVELKAWMGRFFESADDRRGYEKACQAMRLIKRQREMSKKVFVKSDMPFVSGEEVDTYSESRILKLRETLADYVVDKDGKVDEAALRWLRRGLGGYAVQLKESDPDAARRFVVSFGRMMENTGNFFQDSDMQSAAFGLMHAMPGLGLPQGDFYNHTAKDYQRVRDAAAEGFRRHEQELNEADPRRAARMLVGGELNKALTEGLAFKDSASWWEKAYKGAAQMAPQTLPWLVPYAGLPLGAMTSFASQSGEGLGVEVANFQEKYGRMPNAYEMAGLGLRAYEDATISTAVEVLPGQAVGVPFTRWMSKLTGARFGVGAVARGVARLGEKRLGAVAMDTAAGVFEEAIFEPVAQGILTLGADAMMEQAQIPAAHRRGVGEVFAELRENVTNPGQLGAIALTVAVLGGGNIGRTLETSKMLREHSNLLLAAGMSEADVAKVRLSDAPAETAAELYAKALEDDMPAVLERIKEEARKNNQTGELLRRTGRQDVGDEDLQRSLKASWDYLAEQGVLPQVEERPDGRFHVAKKVSGENGTVTLKEYDMDAAEADAFISMCVSDAEAVCVGAKQASVWGLQQEAVRQIYGEAAARAIFQNGKNHGLFIQDIAEAEGMSPELAEEARNNRFAMTAEWLGKAAAQLGGKWVKRAERFRQRLDLEGLAYDAAGSRLFRDKADVKAEFGGRSVWGSMLTYVRGQATASDAVEDVFESVADMQIAARAEELMEQQEGAAASADVTDEAEETHWYDGHLDDETEPIVIDSAVSESVDDLYEDFKDYYRNELAGKEVGIGSTGWTMVFGEGKKSVDTAAKGVNRPRRHAAGKKIAEALSKAFHMGSSTPVHKAGEGKKKSKMIDHTGSFERFGYPIILNGEKRILWMEGATKKGSTEKVARFYEFGISDKETTTPGVKESSSHRPGVAQNSDKVTLGDFLGIVKRENQQKSVALSAAEAWGQAVREMAAKVRPVIEGMALLSDSPQLKAMARDGNWTEERLYMSTLEAMSHIAKSEFLSKRDSLPASWRGGLDAAYDALDYAHEMKQFADAYKAVKAAGTVDVAPLEDVLAAQGVVVNDVFRDARVDEQVIASWRKAKGMVAARAAVEGTGAVGALEALETAEKSEREIAEEEAAKAAVPPMGEEEQKEAAQQLNEELASTPPPAFSAAPEEMRGVFRDDSCTCYAGGFYAGWVAVDKLRDSAEIQQVKVGAKGKHGVTNALVGEFQMSAPPIIVWRRKNGDLEVISGRHRYALAEACGVKFMRADVYNEDAGHDAKWARLMDFENNMRDDQADEKTAFIYVRETGYDDETLYNKGLLRDKTRSRRGAMIARHAREELATRFMNDAVSAKDAETICTMTKDIADKGRIEEIQRRCCMLLDEKKSWEYIGAMVQLMASKESVFLKQGLLDLGADFEADLARAAKYIETCTKQLNEAIAVMKSGRKMSGKQAGLARRLGQLTTSAEDSQQRLDALTAMKAMFDNIGMYPDLVAAAQMWDGKTEVDAVGMALEYGMREAQEYEEEAKMSVEERLAQAEAEANRRAAEEATGSLFGESFSVTSEELSRWGELAAQVMDARETGKRRMHMMKMPRILRELGCRHEYLDIESDTILKAWKDGVPDRRTGHKHNLTREQILRLPVEMADPVIVFEGKVDSPKYRAFVVLTEMRVGEKSVMVAVHLDKKIKNTKVDIIASAYERENNNLFKKLKVLYVDKSRVPAWHPLADAILAGEGSLRNPDGSIVLMKEDIVKNYPHSRERIVPAEKEANRRAAEEATGSLFGESFSVTVPRKRICRTRKEARAMVGRKGGPLHLENRFLELDAVFNSKSDGKFNDGDSIGRSIAMLAADGLSEDEARTAHYTAYGNVAELFANGERMSFERAYKKKDVRKGFLHVYSPFEIEGGNEQYEANIELELHQEAGHLPTAYLLNVYIQKRKPAIESGGDFSVPHAVPASSFREIKTDFPDIVKNYPHNREKNISAEAEMQTIKRNAKHDGTFMKAPNGEPTKLTERQWLQVRTQAFKEWFGDWENDAENASKVVDENGEPLVANHGTDADFTVFDIGKAGKSTPYAGVGFWFSGVQGFGKAWAADDPDAAGAPREMSVYLSLKHPKVYRTRPGRHGDAYEQFAADVAAEMGKDAAFANSGDEEALQAAFREKPETAAKYRQRLEAQGYDGIVLKGTAYDSLYAGDADKPNDQYIAFRSEQAKSVDNRGTFDGGNADITFSLTEAEANRKAAEEATGSLFGVGFSASVVKMSDGLLRVRSDVIDSWEKAESIMRTKMEAMTVLSDKGRRSGIRGKGLVAPGADYEVFIMPISIKTILSGKHVEESVDIKSHYTAAAMLDELWMASRFLEDHADRKNPNNPNLKAIHRRIADLEIAGAVYEVKLTAKEFRNPNETNTLYMVKVESIKKKPLGFSDEASRNQGVMETSVPEDSDVSSVEQTGEIVKKIIDNSDNSGGDVNGFSASVMTESQRREAVKNELARVAAMDKQVAGLADDWERVLGDLERVSRGGEETRLGDGARLYAEMLALISATRAVLPPHLARLGNLNGLMHWAAAYAEMVQHGELPLRGGVIKGAIAEKFLQAMQKRRDALLLQGLSEQEAKEAMAQMGAEKLNAALKKAAVACRDRLNRYVKERAWERIETLAERAMPKSEPGHRSHKGKMDAAHYKELSAALHALNLTEEEMEKEQNELLGRIRALTGTEEGYEETYRELQDSLNRLNLYGCWHAMSASHALKAAEAFAAFVQEGRQQWKETLDVQRRHKAWLMGRMAEGMKKAATANAVSEEQNTDAVGVLRAPARGAKDLIYGLMNLSHLLQAKKRELGDTAVTHLQNMLLHAQEGKHREKSRRDAYMSERLRIFYNCKGEADVTRTLNELQRRRSDHNVRTWKLEKHTYTLDRAEAEAWAAMTREEREKVRERERAEAEKKKLAPPERVEEADIAQLQEVLEEMNTRTRTLKSGEVKATPSEAKTVRLTVRRWNKKPAETLNVSRLNVANALLILEQPGYEHLAEDWGLVRYNADGVELSPDSEEFETGYDLEATLKPLYDFVGGTCMELCHGMRHYIDAYVRPLTEEAYNRRMGIPLRTLPLYWPGTFNISTMSAKDVLTENGGGALGQTAAFTINRVLMHHASADWNKDALEVFFRATDEQLNYVYVGELTNALRDMFMNDAFVKKLEVNCGAQWVRAVKDMVLILDKSVALDAVNMQAMGKVLSRFFGQLAKDALSFNPNSYAKQASGVLNGLTAGMVPRRVIERSDGAKELAYGKAGILEWSAALGRVSRGKGRVSMEALRKREFWLQRYNDPRIEERLRKAAASGSARQSVHAGVLADTGMRAMSAIDRACNAPGLLALADVFCRRLEELNAKHGLGLTDKEMEEQALDAVGRALDVGAQPITAEQKAGLMAAGSGMSRFVLQTATMFKSEIFKDLAQLASQCLSGQWGAALSHYSLRGSFSYGVVCLLALLRFGGDDDDDDDDESGTWVKAVKFVAAALTSDLAAVPVFGELPGGVYDWATGRGGWQKSVPIAGDMEMAYRSAVRLAEKGDTMDEADMARHCKRIMRGLALLLVPISFSQRRWGGVSDAVLDTSVILNPVKMGAEVYKAHVQDE